MKKTIRNIIGTTLLGTSLAFGAGCTSLDSAVVGGILQANEEGNPNLESKF
jgi:hypothetical protein